MLIPSLYFALSIMLAAKGVISQRMDTSVFASRQKIDYDKLLTAIADYGVVECGFTGYKGIASQQCARYEKLLQNSTDLQLYYFSNNPSPTVRVYAMKGLAERKSQYLKEVIAIHQHDTVHFNYHCGCEQKIMPINAWIDLILSKEVERP